MHCPLFHPFWPILFLLGSCFPGVLATDGTDSLAARQSGTPTQPAEIVSLDLARFAWTASTDDQKTWSPVRINAPIEDQLAADFDGVCWYQCLLDLGELALPLDGRAVLLRFDAVATEATVYINDEEVGSHLGGWTPFDINLGPALAKLGAERRNQPVAIKIRVDEKVGHNTQGFLPVIAPHFSGIWQSVRIETARGKLGSQWVKQGSLHCVANPATRTIEVHGQLADPARLPGELMIRSRITSHAGKTSKDF